MRFADADFRKATTSRDQINFQKLGFLVPCGRGGNLRVVAVDSQTSTKRMFAYARDLLAQRAFLPEAKIDNEEAQRKSSAFPTEYTCAQFSTAHGLAPGEQAVCAEPHVVGEGCQ